MALFSFGKKDKPPEAPVAAKSPATLPKVQPLPGAASAQPKAPQPAGLMAAPAGIGSGSATTQPMVMPRGQAGLKAIRVGASQSNRSTQRIILPPTAGSRPSPAAAAAAPPASGRINLPVGMILRCLPAEILTADISQFEANGSAATEVGLPMNLILSQLPSGKVEITLEELITHLPPGFLQPTENLSVYLASVISLPLMDVVMRIPPDLLALRPDQKEVDAAVINMADPFTEDILREQAEAARAAANGEPNIIEESQVPSTEEFVPQAEVAHAPIAAQPSLSRAQPAKPAAVSRPSAPPLPGSIPPGPGAPAAPNSANRTVSPSARMPAPNRATAPIVHRPGNPVPAPAAAVPAAPVVPRPPAPPAPRPSLPIPAPASAAAGSVFQSPLPPAPAVVRRPAAPPAPVPVAPPPIEPEPEPEEPVAAADEPAEASEPASEAPNDELARLAALAMAEMGEDDAPPAETAEHNEAENAALPETEPADSPEPFQAEAPAPVAARAPAPVPRPPAPSLRPPAPLLAATSRPMSAAPAPMPHLRPPAPAAPAAAPTPKPPAPAPVASSVALNLNTCTETDLRQLPGVDEALAQSVIQRREKLGPFRRLEDLLQVPGMSKAAYKSLTGEEAPIGLGSMSINEILGFPADQKITLKDVTDRIMCWPDVTGCVLSQVSGLPLVGSVPAPFEKGAIVAFAPRIFETVNKSFAEIAGRDAEEMILPTAGTSFHFLRKDDFYLIILCRLPQLPDRHLKVARFVLDGLNLR